MVAIDLAISTILDRTLTLSTEIVGLNAALGRVLAETPTARDDMPPFIASAVDGYAVIAGDGVDPRHVLAEVTAGSGNSRPLEQGTTVRIMTGAPVPTGADAVVMV
ncbi:MAG TPA: molybdopterin molybdenumtransferase MoeA, partial [Chloroflexota bacterium]|nr:molybdopterin molybdenumtransferase MoeA [Chloroflexota bacterium]